MRLFAHGLLVYNHDIQIEAGSEMVLATRITEQIILSNSERYLPHRGTSTKSRDTKLSLNIRQTTSPESNQAKSSLSKRLTLNIFLYQELLSLVGNLVSSMV